MAKRDQGGQGCGEALPLGELERRLIDAFQRDLPLVPHPFAAVAENLNSSEEAVIGALSSLIDEGVVSRVGPVFAPHKAGASTLAAMAVPPERLDEVAELVNGYPEVNHNYEREHRFTLWFVVTAPSRERIDAILADIERRTGIGVLDLPLVAAYHIDLGFPVQWS